MGHPRYFLSTTQFTTTAPDTPALSCSRGPDSWVIYNSRPRVKWLFRTQQAQI